MTASEMLDYISFASGVPFDKSAEANSICINGQDTVTFEISDGNLFVMAEVAPASGDMDLDRKLMQMNFLGILTGGNTISLDGRDNEYILHTIFYSGISQEMFEGRFVRFLEALHETKKFIAEYKPESAPADGLRNFMHTIRI